MNKKHAYHRKPPRHHPPPSCKGKVLLLQHATGQCRLISEREYKQQLGRQKAGLVTAGRPNPGRFTSETAKKAISKLWKRWKKRRSGVRRGKPAATRKRVLRAPLRAQHSYWATTTAGIKYYPDVKIWAQNGKVISELVALRRLGYLPYPRKRFVPAATDRIIHVTTRKKSLA